MPKNSPQLIAGQPPAQRLSTRILDAAIRAVESSESFSLGASIPLKSVAEAAKALQLYLRLTATLWLQVWRRANSHGPVPWAGLETGHPDNPWHSLELTLETWLSQPLVRNGWLSLMACVADGVSNMEWASDLGNKLSIEPKAARHLVADVVGSLGTTPSQERLTAVKEIVKHHRGMAEWRSAANRVQKLPDNYTGSPSKQSRSAEVDRWNKRKAILQLVQLTQSDTAAATGALAAGTFQRNCDQSSCISVVASSLRTPHKPPNEIAVDLLPVTLVSSFASIMGVPERFELVDIVGGVTQPDGVIPRLRDSDEAL
jgi:hypothetical protein